MFVLLIIIFLIMITLTFILLIIIGSWIIYEIRKPDGEIIEEDVEDSNFNIKVSLRKHDNCII